jgi:hypothetical protein
MAGRMTARETQTRLLIIPKNPRKRVFFFRTFVLVSEAAQNFDCTTLHRVYHLRHPAPDAPRAPPAPLSKNGALAILVTNAYFSGMPALKLFK